MRERETDTTEKVREWEDGGEEGARGRQLSGPTAIQVYAYACARACVRDEDVISHGSSTSKQHTQSEYCGISGSDMFVDGSCRRAV